MPEDHPQNPMRWSVSPATYARLKLQGVYVFISLAGQNPHEDYKAGKDDQLYYEICMALLRCRRPEAR